MYPWSSQYHPNKHALEITKDDVLVLPAVVARIQWLLQKNGTLVLMNSARILIAFAVLVLALLVCLILVAVPRLRRRERIADRFLCCVDRRTSPNLYFGQ